MRLSSCVAKLQLLLGNVRENKEILPKVREYFKLLHANRICFSTHPLLPYTVLTKFSFLDQAF